MLAARLRFAFCAERVQVFALQPGAAADGEFADPSNHSAAEDDDEPQFRLRAESSEVAPDGETCDVALSDLPPTTQASLPSRQHLREALNIGVLEDESGSCYFGSAPAAGSPQPAHVLSVAAGAGASYDPLAQALCAACSVNSRLVTPNLSPT